MTDLIIRPASQEEFFIAEEWAAAEGWNPGLDDLDVFHATDPGGFLMGWKDGQPVSSISVVRYGPDFGFLGFYIVRPDLRGTGAGLATWNAGLEHLGRRTIGLDGVVAQQENYRRSGFEPAGRNVRFSGVPGLVQGRGERAGIRDFAFSDGAALLEYDRDFFPAPRDTFTCRWTLSGANATRRTKLCERDGRMTGYGVIRACRSGYKVGPLFADDSGTARDLFTALGGDLPGRDAVGGSAGGEVSLDVPETNKAAVALAGEFGLEPVFETARMYRGKMPALPMERTFGLASFELG
jgi:hypothetical protein